jgi:hypothetical protein
VKYRKLRRFGTPADFCALHDLGFRVHRRGSKAKGGKPLYCMCPMSSPPIQVDNTSGAQVLRLWRGELTASSSNARTAWHAPRCDFYVPKTSSQAQLLEADRAAVEDGAKAVEQLVQRLHDVPTRSGRTPRQLTETNVPPCDRDSLEAASPSVQRKLWNQRQAPIGFSRVCACCAIAARPHWTVEPSPRSSIES